MKWTSHADDPWRKKFAFVPLKIDDIWIWFEHYDVSRPFYAYNDICWRRRYPSQL